jgi:hypothetical protein
MGAAVAAVSNAVIKDPTARRIGNIATGGAMTNNVWSWQDRKDNKKRQAGQEMVRQQATADGQIAQVKSREDMELQQRAGIARRRQNRMRSAYGGGGSLLGGGFGGEGRTMLGG